MRRRLVLVAAAFFLGFLCDLIVWGRKIDFAFPSFIFLSLSIGWIAILAGFRRLPSLRSVWLFLPPLFFSTTAWLTAMYPQSLKHIFSLVFTFLYMGLLSVTYLDGQLERYSIFDYPRALFQLALSLVWQPAHFLLLLIRDLQASFRDRSRNTDRSGACALVIIVLVTVLLFTLLCTADAVFITVISPTPAPTPLPPPPPDSTIPSPPPQFVVTPWGVLFWSYLILGIFIYAGTQSRNEQLVADDPRVFRRWFNFTGSTLILGAMLVPLLTYTTFRLACAFTPIMCLDAAGFPAGLYRPYGFWQLAFGAGIVLLLICWMGYATVFDRRADRRIHTFLNLVLFGNVLVILWNAGIGVSLHTFAVHATRHIWYARGGLVWLGAMLGMFIVYEDVESERDFPFAALLVTTFMVILFILARILLGSEW